MTQAHRQSTIVAQATAVGSAGVGIVRLSGTDALDIAAKVLNRQQIKNLLPRTAHFADFFDEQGRLLDQGLVLYFPAPNSFTGEAVIEFQCHGAPVVLQQLINTAVFYGGQLAKPGEFSERAFLNGKLDLLQAEAVADLIAASSARAARAALQSLTGVFSDQVNRIALSIKAVRVQVEASIDFSDEAIEPASLNSLKEQLRTLNQQIHQLLLGAQKGIKLNTGVRVGLVGQPNVGKSRLLNALLGYDRAMVTSVAGTTRDTLQESFHIDGVRFEIVDTAGLHDSDDLLEQEGMRRTRQAIASCDLVLVVQDITQPMDLARYIQQLQIDVDEQTVLARCLGVRNKIDLVKDAVDIDKENAWIMISAELGTGLDQLRQQLLRRAHLQQGEETQFLARQRHLLALQKTADCLTKSRALLKEQVLDLLAEELRLAQQYLGEMVGTVTSDQLLGEIFSTFCIGK
jgi:tRNA modification GTPase